MRFYRWNRNCWDYPFKGCIALLNVWPPKSHLALFDHTCQLRWVMGGTFWTLNQRQTNLLQWSLELGGNPVKNVDSDERNFNWDSIPKSEQIVAQAGSKDKFCSNIKPAVGHELGIMSQAGPLYGGWPIPNHLNPETWPWSDLPSTITLARLKGWKSQKLDSFFLSCKSVL